ncbi:hypothetical protein DPMN_050061 [Dreissena polymorpha]|uniref:Uncharacterized protein n=1 Tax=Dreissena polymorpha TaxID=45954 RepID=A0A9D4CGH6_DREPO|nr:hypothetical protein DPMN_050061 [Dreissena polymorpha]
MLLISHQIWEVYNDRRCIRSYIGHKQAVRDITFNNSGTEFLSCAYDRYCKLWDTETGDIPYSTMYCMQPCIISMLLILWQMSIWSI